jgi:Concanavalin A-like lectin/glucanases superfamily/Chitobiase/beta-hexosaminidase C-terminal domain/Glucodextranase, domain B/Bacterial Ig-like domain
MNALRSLMVGILMLVALITVPVTALAAFSNAIDPDLVGLWHMDGDWGDSSGNGNNGIPYNGVMFSSTDKKVGTQAGIFNGTNSYVSVPNSTSLNIINSMTVELWAKSNINWDAHTNWTFLVNKRNENYSGYGIYIDSNNPRVVFSIINTVGVGYYAPSPNLLPNTWYHIVGTYDGSNIKIYINGQLQNSVPASGTISTNTLNLEIGRWRDAYREYFNGLIDEVAIYKRALSATEIQEQYRTYAVNSPTVNPVTSPTATSTITLSGTKPANTAIVVNGSTLVPLDGTTTWQASYTLSAGMNTIFVTALDSQNLNSLPVTLTVVLDTTPPQVTATTPTNNGILKTAPGAVTFTLADAFSPLDFTSTLNGATVTNAPGFNIAGTWSTSGSGTTGSVTFTPSAALSDGSYTATIKPTDTLANGSNYTLTFTIDSTPPVAPGIDPVTAPINTTSKTITGTKSSDSASVAVSCAGATIGTISYPTATTWSVNVSGLKEGSNTITAYAVDTAGNPSATATATITVDTTPPAVGATPAGGIYNSTQSVALASNEPDVIYYTTDGSTPTASATVYSQPISIPAGATLKYFGRDLAGNNSEIKTENYVIDTTPPVLAISTLSDGAYTNNEILNIAGTVTDNTGVKGITVNDTAVQVNADGSFSYALLLKNGVDIITIAATDIAGNVAADTRTVTLAQTAPVLAVTMPADNSKTGKALLEVSGTVDKTSAVTVKIKDIVQSAVMNGEAFTATITLDPGYNTIDITATDLAGNQSSLKRTVVFDDQVPSLAVTVPNQDVRTNQSSLTIKGTVYDALTAVGVTISMDNEIFTPQVIDGTFEQVVNFTEEKTYGIVVTATNEVGISASVQRNVIYDITPPALSIDPVTSPTTQSSLSVSGTREAGAAVTVTSATVTVGEVLYPTTTTWQADISGMREGENVITAASADAAGNAVTATATIVLATVLPQITITATPDVIWPPNHKMVLVTIAGGVDANGSDIKSVSISVSDEYGKYEYNNLTFGSTVMLEAWRNENDTDGRKYTITVVVTDRGGITTAKTATVTVPHEMSIKKILSLASHYPQKSH